MAVAIIGFYKLNHKKRNIQNFFIYLGITTN